MVSTSEQTTQRRRYTAQDYLEEKERREKAQAETRSKKEEERQKALSRYYERIKTLAESDTRGLDTPEKARAKRELEAFRTRYSISKPSSQPEQRGQVTNIFGFTQGLSPEQPGQKPTTAKERAMQTAEQFQIRQSFPTETRFIPYGIGVSRRNPATGEITKEYYPTQIKLTPQEKKTTGTYKAYIPDEKFKGVYEAEKKAGMERIASFRDTNRIWTGITPKEFAYSTLAEFERIKAEPGKAALGVGAFALGSLIGGFGLGLTTTEIGTAAFVYPTAYGYVKERKEGGTGAETLGATTFYAGSAFILGEGFKFVKSTVYPKDTAKYTTYPTAKGTIGVGEVITGGKKGKSIFISEEGITRTITKTKEGTLETITKGTEEASTFISSKGRKIESFKYIEPTKFDISYSKPVIQKRVFASEIETKTGTTAAFQEQYLTKGEGGFLKGKTKGEFKIDIKDIFERKAFATPEITQVTKVSAIELTPKLQLKPQVTREVSSRVVQFEYDKPFEPLKDIIITEKGRVERIAAPRYFERTEAFKTGKGEIIFEKEKAFDLGKLFKSKKAGITLESPELITETRKVTIKQPTISETKTYFPQAETIFRINKPLLISGISTSSLYKTGQKISISAETRQKLGLGLSSSSITKLNIGTSPTTKEITTQGISQSIKQSTKQNIKYDLGQVTTQKTGGGFGFDFGKPKPAPPEPTPPTPPPPIIGFPKLKGLYFPEKATKETKKKAKKIKKYKPSVQAIVYNIRGKADIKQAATGLGLRPISGNANKGFTKTITKSFLSI